MKTPVWLTEQQKCDMATKYAQGASARSCAQMFNVDPSTAAHWIARQGTPLRSAKEARREYRVNDKAFSQSSSDAAYWLGFLLADGCISQRPRRSLILSIALQAGDRAHLEALRAFLSAEHPIATDMRRNCVVLSIASDQLCDDLMRKGCHPRKSLALCYQASGYFYRRHFIRGYFDGDGASTSMRLSIANQRVPS
jgi:hypothetical protein